MEATHEPEVKDTAVRWPWLARQFNTQSGPGELQKIILERKLPDSAGNRNPLY